MRNQDSRIGSIGFVCTAHRIVVCAALCVIAVVFSSGCRTKQNPDKYPSTIQVVNALQDSNGIQASLDKNRVARTVKFDNSTGLYGVQPGIYALSVVAIGGLDVQPRQLLREGSFTVDPDKHYTAVAFGAPGSELVPASLAIFDDNKPTPDQRQDMIKRGVSSISIFNAGVASGKVDITVSSIVTFKSIAFGHRSSSVEIASEPYEWGVAPAGSTDQTLGQPITLHLEPGESYLLVITGNVNSGDIQITPFED
jgi:hypothetical protein